MQGDQVCRETMFAGAEFAHRKYSPVRPLNVAGMLPDNWLSKAELRTWEGRCTGIRQGLHSQRLPCPLTASGCPSTNHKAYHECCQPNHGLCLVHAWEERAGHWACLVRGAPSKAPRLSCRHVQGRA